MSGLGFNVENIKCSGDSQELVAKQRETGLNDSNKLCVKILSAASKAPDMEVIEKSLGFAVNYYKTETDPDYTAGPAAYEVWARALEEGRANGEGAALNAAAFAECRRYAVDFLKECEAKSPGDEKVLWAETIDHFRVVSEKLGAVEKLFPFFIPGEQKVANVSNVEKCLQAAQLLREAKEAESEGLIRMGALLEVMLSKSR